MPTPGVTLAGCGVDTWRAGWYVDPEGPAAEWFMLNGVPAGAKDGGGFRLQHKVADHVVGVASGGLVYAEGHPAGTDDKPALARAAELPAAYERLCDQLRSAGVPLPAGRSAELVDLTDHGREGARGLRRGSPRPRHRREGAAGFARLDVTADFETPSPVYGRELLRALHAVQLQRAGVTSMGQLGAMETVAIRSRGGRRILARFYDKGRESNAAPPFRLLRAEDQGRFPAQRRRGIESIDAAFLRERFRRRWGPLALAGKELGEVTIADPLVLAERIQRLADRGVITPAKATRMAGNIVLDHVSGRMSAGAHRGTVWRHRRELIDFGLIRESGELAEPLQLQLAEPFELVAMREAWA